MAPVQNIFFFIVELHGTHSKQAVYNEIVYLVFKTDYFYSEIASCVQERLFKYFHSGTAWLSLVSVQTV